MVSKVREMKLFSGSAHPEFAARVCENLGVPLAATKLFRFSDGEIGVSIEESVRGADVFVMQPTCSPVNENLMELLIMVDALHRASAYRVNVVTPYFGYARQDRKTRAREPITAKLVSNIIEKSGADRLVSADLHAGQIQGFFDIPVDHLTGINLLASAFRGELKEAIKENRVVVVSPDIGGVVRARRFAVQLVGHAVPGFGVPDFRVAPGDTVESVMQHVRYTIGNPLLKTATIGVSRDPSSVSPTDSDAYRLIERTIRET